MRSHDGNDRIEEIGWICMLMLDKTQAVLRPASTSDAVSCARLIHLCGPRIYEFQFANRPPTLFHLFEYLSQQNHNLLSLSQATVCEHEGMVVGMVLGFPARDAKKRSLSTFRSMLFGRSGVSIASCVRSVFRFARLDALGYPALHSDEYFISNLSTLESHRRQGIARRLLMHIEQFAIENDFRKLSVYVEVDNTCAIESYERCGFTKAETDFLPPRFEQHGLKGFSKMVKVLKADAEECSMKSGNNQGGKRFVN
ncbi:MAG: GNAT family N-acetyltransferase [Pirellulaceae bacterium]